MKNPIRSLCITALALLTSACIADLNPIVPEGTSKIHLTGNYWSPNNPRVKARGDIFGGESPYTIWVQRITDAGNGSVMFDRSQTPRSVIDSVYVSVPPGTYTVEYTCFLMGRNGERVANLNTRPVTLTAKSGEKYNVGIYDVTTERTANFGGPADVPAGTCLLSYVERAL